MTNQQPTPIQLNSNKVTTPTTTGVEVIYGLAAAPLKIVSCGIHFFKVFANTKIRTEERVPKYS